MSDQPLQQRTPHIALNSRGIVALFVSFWLVFLVVFRSQPFNDPGALWHVRVGQTIFAHGFPHTDPFTWSYAGKHWIPQQWGAECLMALAHRIGGFDAMLATLTALFAALAAWLTKRFTDAGLHWMPAAGIVAFGMAVACFHFYLRPHLFTIVLMSVVMAWLVDFDRGRISAKRLIWLIPLCTVWTNLHGGVLGGIFTFGLAIGGWMVLSPKRKQGTLDEPLACALGSKPALPIGGLSLILIGCMLSIVINPFGLDMQRTWWSIVGSETVKNYMEEHKPLDLHRSDGKAVVAFGVFYLLMLAGTLPKRPRVMWLIPLIWLVLSFTSIRHGPLFCAVGLVALADLLPETIWFRLLRKYGDTFARDPAEVPKPIRWQAWSAMAGAVLIALGMQFAKLPIPFIGYGWAQFDSKMVPVEMIEPLQEYAKTRPDGFPIFNDANLGGFLIYFTPTLKVFMDDRCELYGEAGLRDYIDTVHDHPERIEEWSQKAPFDRALVESDTVMDDYLKKSERWKEVARCKKAALYERVR